MPLNIRFTPEGERVMNRMRRGGPWFTHAIRDVLEEAGDIVSAEARDLAPRDTGRGIRSIRPRVRRNHVDIEAFDYMVVLDQGRRAGARQPPVDAIRPWLLRQQGRGRLRGANAYVIARAIGRRGIRPRRYFLAAARTLRRNREFQQQVAAAFSRRLRRG